MSTPGFTPDGTQGWTQADSDRLHFRKNQPPKPAVNGVEMEFPPYQFYRYPCAMYHATDVLSPKLVTSEMEDGNLRSRGWRDTPDEATAWEKDREADVAGAAAFRAYDDQHMSVRAKAEVAALEEASNDFVSDVPAPKRKPGRPRKEAA